MAAREIDFPRASLAKPHERVGEILFARRLDPFGAPTVLDDGNPGILNVGLLIDPDESGRLRIFLQTLANDRRLCCLHRNADLDRRIQ